MDTSRTALLLVSSLALSASASAAGLPAAYLEAKPPGSDALTAETSCLQTTVSDDPGLDYCVNEADYHGFTLSNRGSSRINQAGGAVRRDFIFSAPQNARQEIGLLVYEWGSPDPGGDDSAWSMLSEFVFFPRKVVPSLRLVSGGAAYEVTLPTGETVLFDAKTKEILGGALVETAAIDMSRDRFIRKFAGLRYEGRGILVRSDQRGDTPRSAVVWGQKKSATVFWRGKTCKVSPADVWRQEGASLSLYADDAGFYDVLRLKCGWTVAAAAFE